MITVRNDRNHIGLLATGIQPKWSARCVLPDCGWSTAPERFAGSMTAGQHLDQLLEHLAEAHGDRGARADLPYAYPHRVRQLEDPPDDRGLWPTP